MPVELICTIFDVYKAEERGGRCADANSERHFKEHCQNWRTKKKAGEKLISNFHLLATFSHFEGEGYRDNSPYTTLDPRRESLLFHPPTLNKQSQYIHDDNISNNYKNAIMIKGASKVNERRRDIGKLSLCWCNVCRQTFVKIFVF